MHSRHVVEHTEVGHLRGVRRTLTHPDPDRLVLFGHGIAADACARRDVLGAMGVTYAGTRWIELKAVIRTSHAVAGYNLAHVQGREPVRANILKRDDISM